MFIKTRKRKRARTGNGTATRQWLYLFWNIPFIFIFKIGIGGNYKARSREVDRTTPGWVFPIFAVKVFFAYDIEQALHRFLGFYRIPFWGSGKREWFLILVFPIALAVFLVAFITEWLVIIGLIFLTLWLLAGSPKLF